MTTVDILAEPAKELVDVTSTPLRELRRTGPNSPLASVTRRVVDEVIGRDLHVQEQIPAD